MGLIWEPTMDLEWDAVHNVFGSGHSVLEDFNQHHDGFRLCLAEFKQDGRLVIEDFRKEIKSLSDLDLLVCWEIDQLEDADEYIIKKYDSPHKIKSRMFFGSTHYIIRNEHSCDVIALKDFLLNA
jgi:hypothetical protein